MKKEYQINIVGCNDTTYITMLLTENEYETIAKLADESVKNSSYSCQPVLNIYEL